jgi:phosphoribosylanthranilate isomerase
MGLKLAVKVSDISNLSNARYCAGMGVEYLGFNLNETSSSYINPTQFQDITYWVAGVCYVGEFAANTDVADIKLASQNYQLDFIQVENIDILEELSELDNSLIFKLWIEDQQSLEVFETKISAILPFTKKIIVASGKTELFQSIDQKVASIRDDVEWIKAYGISTSNIQDIVNNNQFSGIELVGADEERPGFNDYGDLMDILEALEED